MEFALDGAGRGQIHTTIPFLDHMLQLLSKHGFFDLTIQAKGDTEIDDHHTVEDIGIVLGGLEAVARQERRDPAVRVGFRSPGRNARTGDDRFKRPAVSVYRVELFRSGESKSFDLGLFEDFFQAFVTHGGLNLHVNVLMAAIHITSWRPFSRPWLNHLIRPPPWMNGSPVCFQQKVVFRL